MTDVMTNRDVLAYLIRIRNLAEVLSEEATQGSRVTQLAARFGLDGNHDFLACLLQQPG